MKNVKESANFNCSMFIHSKFKAKTKPIPFKRCEFKKGFILINYYFKDLRTCKLLLFFRQFKKEII